MMPVDHCFYIYSSGRFGWIVPPGDGVKAVNVWTSGLDPKNLLSVLHDLVILEHGKTKTFSIFTFIFAIISGENGKHKNYISLSNVS